jgi:pimeloyl-ACP methyl ester carboxylesterase
MTRAQGGGTGVRHHKVAIAGVVLHYVEAGAPDGEAVVLLHGWPQSWFAWRRVLPQLPPRYRVIAPDLRGFGDSAKPASGYDTLTVAGDIVGLLDRLGIDRAHLVGHDFGAATAHALAAEWRDRAATLAILDMLMPGFGLEDAVRFGPDGFGLWRLAFHAVPDVAEMLVAGREREYLGWFFRNHAYDPSAIPAEDLDVYVRNFRQAGAARAAFGYYRALYQDATRRRRVAASRPGACSRRGVQHRRGRGRRHAPPRRAGRGRRRAGMRPLDRRGTPRMARRTACRLSRRPPGRR